MGNLIFLMANHYDVSHTPTPSPTCEILPPLSLTVKKGGPDTFQLLQTYAGSPPWQAHDIEHINNHKSKLQLGELREVE